jgi:aspartate/methionine/tyrosine aminotransferase
MNSFAPSGRMVSVRMPPISRIMRRIAELKSRGRRIFSMAQAVPWYSPPKNALEGLLEDMDDPRFHRYSPDPGYLSTRIALADDFRRRRNVDLDPNTELQLTCGASQAFLSALLAVTSVGDSVAVLEPYYFDHIFAIQFSGLELVSIRMTETEEGWKVPTDRLEQVMERVGTLVLVNPGNPTGMVIPDATMRMIHDLALRTGTFLIIDETYERFVYTGDDWHPWKDGKHPNVLTLGSFSKSLGMPGWRLGYLFGPSELLRHAIKVQDSVVICPPSPSQLLLERAIAEEGWISEMSRGVEKRLHHCREALTGNNHLRWRESGGAFFTLASIQGGMNSQDAAMYLLEEYGIGTIPGSAFGDAGEGHLRISFGCLDEDEIQPAMDALSSVTLPG